MKKFSFLAANPNILTPRKFFVRGTLENRARNTFGHNGWEKILAIPQDLVHDWPSEPLYLVFIALAGF
jgi:hypothetical protein